MRLMNQNIARSAVYIVCWPVCMVWSGVECGGYQPNYNIRRLGRVLRLGRDVGDKSPHQPDWDNNVIPSLGSGGLELETKVHTDIRNFDSTRALLVESGYCLHI